MCPWQLSATQLDGEEQGKNHGRKEERPFEVDSAKLATGVAGCGAVRVRPHLGRRSGQVYGAECNGKADDGDLADEGPSPADYISEPTSKGAPDTSASCCHDVDEGAPLGNISERN